MTVERSMVELHRKCQSVSQNPFACQLDVLEQVCHGWDYPGGAIPQGSWTMLPPVAEAAGLFYTFSITLGNLVGWSLRSANDDACNSDPVGDLFVEDTNVGTRLVEVVVYSDGLRWWVCYSSVVD